MTFAEMRRAMRADGIANRGNHKGVYVLWCYRWAQYFASKQGHSRAIYVLGLPYLVFYRIWIEWIWGVEIPAKVTAGDGLVLWHGQGLVVSPGAVLGRGVVLRQNTTIGTTERDGVRSAAPVIGDRVDIGANVVMIGPLTIGEGAVIGAGAVVTRDVAPGAIVVGNPARPIGNHDDVAGAEPVR